MFKNCDLLVNLTIYNYNDNDCDDFNKFIEFEESQKFSENDVDGEDDEHPIYKNLKNEYTASTITKHIEDIEFKDKYH